MNAFLRREDFERVIGNLRKFIRAKGQKPQVRTLTITEGMLDESDKFPLKTHDMRVQFLDPGGSNRDVSLPEIVKVGAEYTVFPKDCYFVIFNTADASENLVIKYKVTIDGSPTTYTILTLNQNEGGEFWSNGVEWRGFKGGIT